MDNFNENGPFWVDDQTLDQFQTPSRRQGSSHWRVSVRIALTFGILFATALIDVLLFFLVGNALMCYRCFAQYRGLEEIEEHGPFNLETHERYRQAAARQKEQAQRGGAPAASPGSVAETQS